MAATNVIDSSVSAALNATSESSIRSGALELQESFLTLLVAQLKNQDPMNPVENAEMTSATGADQYRQWHPEFERHARKYQRPVGCQPAAAGHQFDRQRCIGARRPCAGG